MTKTPAISFGLAALCLNACILDSEERSCTLALYEDNLMLTAIDYNMGTPVERFKGSATMGTTITEFECGDETSRGPGYECFGPNQVRIKGTPTDSVTIKITSSGVPTEEIIPLTPTTSEPNGPGCGFYTQAQATMKVTQACTAIGCYDHVRLTLVDAAQQPITAFSGTVTVGGVQTAITCDATTKMGTNYTCTNNSLEIAGIPGSTIDVDLSAGDKAMKQQVVIEPTTRQPNGRGCLPVCSIAETTITLE